MREGRKKWNWRITALPPTKFLNSALALKVYNLHHKKSELHLPPHSLLLGRHWQVLRPFTVWSLGVNSLSGTSPPPTLANFSTTKVSAFRCLFQLPLSLVCRGNWSFYLLLWKYNVQNIFETFHVVLYMIILFFLIIKVICTVKNLVKYFKSTKTNAHLPERISHSLSHFWYIPFVFSGYISIYLDICRYLNICTTGNILYMQFIVLKNLQHGLRNNDYYRCIIFLHIPSYGCITILIFYCQMCTTWKSLTHKTMSKLFLNISLLFLRFNPACKPTKSICKYIV